ncbi:MAG: DUF4192 domain-containing protein [Demequinaceae bacterium]|nr:DUF4192 domain-containing protein [Demequinaceae bacterium]
MESTRLHGPGALVAAIPSLLGYRPSESVVVVSLRRRGEVGILLRVDRVDCLHPDIAEPLARSIAGRLVQDHAIGAFLVSYTEDHVRLACPALDSLRPVVADAVEEVETWAVVGDRYFFPGCARESCCPAKGRPVPEAPAWWGPPIEVASIPHRLATVSPDAQFEVDETARRRAARAGERWWAHRGDDVVAWRRRSYVLWRKAVEGMRFDRYPVGAEAGKLIEALQDRRVRDAVLVSLLPGSGKVARGVLDGSADDRVSEVLRTLLSPEDGTPPAKEAIGPAWNLLGWLTAHARVNSRAPTLTLCAVLAWWEGDGEACRGLLARAHDAEPGYRLAGLLECTVLAGIDPGWKRAGWQEVPSRLR